MVAWRVGSKSNDVLDNASQIATAVISEATHASRSTYSHEPHANTKRSGLVEHKDSSSTRTCDGLFKLLRLTDMKSRCFSTRAGTVLLGLTRAETWDVKRRAGCPGRVLSAWCREWLVVKHWRSIAQ